MEYTEINTGILFTPCVFKSANQYVLRIDKIFMENNLFSLGLELWKVKYNLLDYDLILKSIGFKIWDTSMKRRERLNHLINLYSVGNLVSPLLT